jgi:phage-related protein
VLIADLMLAAAIVVVVGAIASAFGTVSAAVQDDREAAGNAAVIAARSGDSGRAAYVAGRIAPEGNTVEITATPDQITVRVSTPIAAAHPVLGRIRLTTVAEEAVPVAPYRSARG